MENRILIDTNVLIDYVLTREPFFDGANKVIVSCTEGITQACIAAHSISNMFYILRKEFDVGHRTEILINLCKIFDVEGIDMTKLLSGLENEYFIDFEDCLQMECAKTYGVEYIVTRNVSDYITSEIKAVTPEEYLELLNGKNSFVYLD